ncbi:protocadherin alpha-C2-like protein [Labeo rohita]|uniref:Protocadherin alpha-C2-like protein n=1 Tax=Labeo rohita TaxID=84645 RepID=A0A498LB33_LABRO|nr:protocadherin alpha-C2-like protein [Labeo rohita]
MYLVIGLGSVSFLLLITILVTIVLKCQKSKPSKAAPPCRNSVISERNSTIADSTLVSNDAYWYSLFLAETRKGKLVVRQPVPKGARYIVSSIPRSTGLTETSDSAASTLQMLHHSSDWLYQLSDGDEATRKCVETPSTDGKHSPVAYD